MCIFPAVRMCILPAQLIMTIPPKAQGFATTCRYDVVDDAVPRLYGRQAGLAYPPDLDKPGNVWAPGCQNGQRLSRRLAKPPPGRDMSTPLVYASGAAAAGAPRGPLSFEVPLSTRRAGGNRDRGERRRQ